jgi:hypothetical protein
MPRTDAEFQQIMDAYDLVLIGSIAAPEPQSAHPNNVHVSVEKVYKGPTPSVVVIDQPIDSGIPPAALIDGEVESLGPDCSYTLLGQPGERYLLFLTSRPNGTYEPGGCSSSALRASRSKDWLQPLDRLTGGVPAAPPDTGVGHLRAASDSWIIPLLVAAGAIGAAGVLLFVGRRRTAA